MINFSLFGAAAAILLCALLAKRFATQPKASKSQRAEIIERLLALSEEENKRSRTASSVRTGSSVRLRTAVPAKGARCGYSAAVRSNK